MLSYKRFSTVWLEDWSVPFYDLDRTQVDILRFAPKKVSASPACNESYVEVYVACDLWWTKLSFLVSPSSTYVHIARWTTLSKAETPAHLDYLKVNESWATWKEKVQECLCEAFFEAYIFILYIHTSECFTSHLQGMMRLSFPCCLHYVGVYEKCSGRTRIYWMQIQEKTFFGINYTMFWSCKNLLMDNLKCILGL